MTHKGPIELDIYFDYGCPYAYAGAVWLDQVRQQLGDKLQLNCRFFPLEQVNAPDEAFKLWEKPAEYKSRGRAAFTAAAAAERQGVGSFERFHFALFRLKHEQGKDHGKRATLEEAAEEADLDLAQFRRDLDDTSLWDRMRVDFERGRNEFGVFGTPTIIFDNGQGAYLKLNHRQLPEDPLAFFRAFVDTVRDRPSVLEIKRPSPPSKAA